MPHLSSLALQRLRVCFHVAKDNAVAICEDPPKRVGHNRPPPHHSNGVATCARASSLVLSLYTTTVLNSEGPPTCASSVAKL
jgi:hypothetical protein